ncbi:MAG: glycosyltransferase family 4 protein [Pseudohongiellaceae bacterium]
MSLQNTFLLLLTLFVASLLLTRLVLLFAPRFGLVDMPGERSSHGRPVPRGGGLAVVLVCNGFFCWLALTGALALTDLVMLLLSLPIAMVGLVDDWRSLGHRWRVVAQLLMAVAVFALLRELPPLHVGGANLDLGILAWLVVPLAISWLCNLYNFMDGIDGLAAAQCCFVAAGAAWLIGEQSESLSLLILGLFVTSAGFLVWNWSPARVFMGDVGSTWLGFVFGVLILITVREQILTIWVWFLLLSVFIADTGWTLGVRLVRGCRPYEAHSSHAYQIAARRFGHAPVVLAIMAINLLYVMPLAWWAESHPHYGVYLAFSGIVPLIVLCWRLGAGTDRNR